MASERRGGKFCKALTNAPLPTLAPIPKREINMTHLAVVDAWFANGCRSKREALQACGIMSSNVHIWNRPEVQAEIRRRFDLRADAVARSEAEIIREYEKIAFANLGDLLEIQEDGTAWLDMSSLSNDQKAAIAEYHVETYAETKISESGGAYVVPVKKARIKFHDKKAALDSLVRIHGMNKDKLEISVSQNLVDRVAEARKRLTIDQNGDPA